jgi:hypothetical protein
MRYMNPSHDVMLIVVDARAFAMFLAHRLPNCRQGKMHSSTINYGYGVVYTSTCV